MRVDKKCLEDITGMAELIPLVERGPCDTAFVTVTDDAVTAPPALMEDVPRGPHTITPCKVY